MRVKSFFKNSLILSVLCVCLTACQRNSQLSFRIREVDFLNKSDVTVHGVPLDAEWPLETRGVVVCDSFLILTSIENEAQVYVYSDDLKLLGKFCYMGRARNEFLRAPYMPSQQILRDEHGNALLPFCDKDQGIKVMDLQQSLASHSTVISMYRDFVPSRQFKVPDERYGTATLIVDYRFLFLDNDITHTFEEYQPEVVDGVVLMEPLCAVMHDSVLIKSISCLDYFDKNNVRYINGSLYKHPSRNIVIKALNDYNYILFFDLDHDKTFAIHQTGSRTFNDEVDYEHFPCFYGGSCTDSYFMLTYYAGDAPTELMFFDWDGNFLKSVKLDVMVQGSVSFDKRKQILYGISMEKDRLLSFDLSDVIKAFAATDGCND